MTKSFTTRWKVRPSKYFCFARNTKLFTVFGAAFGSRSIVIFPHDVSIVAVYFLAWSMVIGGGSLNVGRFGFSGGLVSLHCTLASAAWSTVVVDAAGPLAVVVLESVAEVVFLSSFPPKRAAARTARTIARPATTAMRMALCFFFAWRAASSWAARAASRFWRWRSRFGSGMGPESKWWR